jgi:chromosome segregation ATPase
MALQENKTSNGWLSQAERLAIMHGTAGTKAINAADLARQQPLLKLAKSNSDFAASDEPLDAATREIDLAKDLEAALTKIASLQRRLAREKTTSESLKRELESVSERLNTAEATVADLGTDLAATQSTAALHDSETLSLQTSLDLASAENARLQAQHRLSTSLLEDANVQAKTLWNEAAAAEAKRVAYLKEAERYRAEAEAKNELLQAAKARAELAEQLHAKARERLSFSAEENSVNMGKIAELKDICNDRSKKVDELQVMVRSKDSQINELKGLVRSKETQIDELEKSRHDLAVATNALLASYQSHQSVWLQHEACETTEDPQVEQVPAPAQITSRQETSENRRSKLIELARELAKLSIKRKIAASARTIAAPALLANTISF